MRNDAKLDELANDMVSAIETANVAMLHEILSPDFVLWQNTSMIEMPRDTAFQVITMLLQIPELKYLDIRRNYWDEGFVSQHVVTGKNPDGTMFRLPACFIATVRDGQIARLDEWWDSAAFPRG